VNAIPAFSALFLSPEASKAPRRIKSTAIAQGFIESTKAAPIIVSNESSFSLFVEFDPLVTPLALMSCKVGHFAPLFSWIILSRFFSIASFPIKYWFEINTVGIPLSSFFILYKSK